MPLKNRPPAAPGAPEPALSSPTRRSFLGQIGALGAALAIEPQLAGAAAAPAAASHAAAEKADGLSAVTLRVNGQEVALRLDPRTTLLDALREHAGLTGTKKGCDHGACGACTVLADGRRVLSCLTLAVAVQGRAITTIEGLSQGDVLHPVQQAFIDCDAFQCGFCTSGQILSAVACLSEGHAGSPDEIRRWMSGNLCRCGAYPNIAEAIGRVRAEGKI
jgi:xanthine dehydrogenase YagT iron-sulfur-binding subunit